MSPAAPITRTPLTSLPEQDLPQPREVRVRLVVVLGPSDVEPVAVERVRVDPRAGLEQVQDEVVEAERLSAGAKPSRVDREIPLTPMLTV